MLIALATALQSRMCASVSILLHLACATASADRLGRCWQVQAAEAAGKYCGMLIKFPALITLLPSFGTCLSDIKVCIHVYAARAPRPAVKFRVWGLGVYQ